MRFLQRLAASISLFALTLPAVALADVPVRSCCAIFEASAISRCFQLNDNLPGTPTQDQLAATRNAQEQTCKDVPLQYQDHQGGSAQWIKNDVNNSGVCGTASSVVCTTIRDQYSRTYFPLHAMCESVSNCPNQTSYLCQEGFCKLKDGQRCTGSEGSEANCADGLLCRSTPEGFKCLAPDADVSGSGGTAVGGFVSQEPAPFVPVVPKLGVPIPGFSFTSATEENGLVAVPYLSQYINAIYRYMTAIVLTVAIVMVMIGGFKYLLSATPLGVSDGKKMITDSLIGMVLVLGAYVILNTINPNLTSLKTLYFERIEAVNLDPIILAEQEAAIDSPTPELAHTGESGPFSASAVQYADTANANMEMCGQLAPYFADGTLESTPRMIKAYTEDGYFSRAGTPGWCNEMNSRRTDPDSCNGLMTKEVFSARIGGRATTYDETNRLPINPWMCRYLLDIARAKTQGLITGSIRITDPTSHARCSSGAWFYSREAENTCVKLKPKREECLRCAQGIIAGNASARQSNHWNMSALDLRPNDSLQRYSVDTLVPLYTRLNGGRAVIGDLFGPARAPGEACGTVKRYQCLDWVCQTRTLTPSIISGHTCSNLHIHISFQQNR